MKKLFSFMFVMLSVITLASCRGDKNSTSGSKKINLNTSAEIKNMADTIDTVGDLSEVYQNKIDNKSSSDVQSNVQLNSNYQLKMNSISLNTKLLAETKEEEKEDKDTKNAQSDEASLEDIIKTKRTYQDVIDNKNLILNSNIEYLNVWTDIQSNGVMACDDFEINTYIFYDWKAKNRKARITFDETNNNLYLEILSSIDLAYWHSASLQATGVLNSEIKSVPTPEAYNYVKISVGTENNNLYYQYINGYFANILPDRDGCLTYPNNLFSVEKVEYLENSYYEYTKYKNYGRSSGIVLDNGDVYGAYPFTDNVQHKFTWEDLWGKDAFTGEEEKFKNIPYLKINRKNSDRILYEVKRVDLTSENPVLYYCKQETNPIMNVKDTLYRSGDVSANYPTINFNTGYRTNISKLYTIIDDTLVEYYKESENSYVKFSKKNSDSDKYSAIACIYSIKDADKGEYYAEYPIGISNDTVTLEMFYPDILGIKNIPNFDKDSCSNGTGVIEFENGITLENLSLDSEVYYYPLAGGIRDSVFIESVNGQNTIIDLLNKYNISNSKLDIINSYKYLDPVNIPGFDKDAFKFSNKEVDALVESLKINLTDLQKDYDNVEEIKKPFNLNLEITYNDTSKLIQLDGKSLLKIEVKMEEIKSTNSDIDFGDIPVLYLYIDGKMIEKQETSVTEDGLVINFEEAFDELKDGNMKIELRLASMGINIPISYVIVDGTATETQASNN